MLIFKIKFTFSVDFKFSSIYYDFVFIYSIGSGWVDSDCLEWLLFYYLPEHMLPILCTLSFFIEN